ncbi:ETC complex I subunit conserved region-domain-containing protein [Polychytrium aggregatum]|uniref:ETC complex I subunit conserved region-domain-containing protein n=1 Tax=Polychytrium aggregatum TaxID=110093 RepID=UPI0022FF2740|nr:ETC complex I subunit conserved region-domain-containing protein [Polychytrium aggregatum]KAI9204145.1 ETC complex I subunit conserved region-domain-containing protein [Polychytrium aggregatum]
MFFSRVLRQAPAFSTKTTTGLYGLAVHPNPRPQLISLYKRIIHAVQRQPESAVFRQSVESLARHRLAIVEQENDIDKIETTIQAGQIEELIQQAEDELKLVNIMENLRPWEPLETKAPEGQWVYFN